MWYSEIYPDICNNSEFEYIWGRKRLKNVHWEDKKMRGHSNVTMCEWLINSFITFFVIGWFTFSGPWRLRCWYPNKERRLHASQKKYHFALRADFKGKFFQSVFSGKFLHSNLFSSCELLKLLLEQLYLEAGLQNTEEKEKRDNFYSLTVDIASSEFRCYCITTRLLRQNISLGTYAMIR